MMIMIIMIINWINYQKNPVSAICVQNFDDSRICNSHQLSQFAAFFIVMGTKTSIVQSSYKNKYIYIYINIYDEHYYDNTFIIIRYLKKK
jgi:hypothetical protein